MIAKQNFFSKGKIFQFLNLVDFELLSFLIFGDLRGSFLINEFLIKKDMHELKTSKTQRCIDMGVTSYFMGMYKILVS